MVSALTAQVEARSVAATLSKIDIKTRNARAATEVTHNGPFGVIDFQTSHSDARADVASQVGSTPHHPSVPQYLIPTLPASANVADNSPLALPEVDFTLQWDDLFALDFDNELGMAQDDLFLIDLSPELPFDALTGVLQDDHGAKVDVPVTEHERLPTFVREQAPFLLKHFHDRVIPSMAGLPFGSKSPWKIQNVPNAVQTLAELTYLEIRDIKHAKLAILYAIFSCSAYQLATLHETPGNWLSILNHSRHEAKKHLQLTLREELSGPRKAKYKDQLMAILSFVSLAVFSGDRDDARRLIIEAERLLRTRGLAKRYISRRCRMLHHIYTWTRIIAESTYVLHDYRCDSAVERQSQGDGTRSSSAELHRSQGEKEARLDNFLRLASNQEEIRKGGPKDPSVGLHDIHLDDPREYEATMYDQIYGLPEPWLSLLSSTTKLANAMDARRLSGCNPDELARPDILEKRARTLESMVCSFAARDVVGDSSTPNYHMTRALTAALVIYFYRRIRGVNSWMMQSHIDNVISALKDFDNALQLKMVTGPGTAWPAFIAGCEALSRNRREGLSAWLEKGYQQTGLRGYQAAMEQMHEVWRRHDEVEAQGTTMFSSPVTSSWTWTAVSRDRGEWVLLC